MQRDNIKGIERQLRNGIGLQRGGRDVICQRRKLRLQIGSREPRLIGSDNVSLCAAARVLRCDAVRCKAISNWAANAWCVRWRACGLRRKIAEFDEKSNVRVADDDDDDVMMLVLMPMRSGGADDARRCKCLQEVKGAQVNVRWCQSAGECADAECLWTMMAARKIWTNSKPRRDRGRS